MAAMPGPPDQGQFCRFFVEATDTAVVVGILTMALGLRFAKNSTVADGLDHRRLEQRVRERGAPLRGGFPPRQAYLDT
jgi:hypothetical protein